jgi:integrase
MPLNDSLCKNAKPSEKARKLSDGHGLYLEVTPTGGRYWRLKYRYQGKEKRLALGVYPEVSLAQAREKREHARKVLLAGGDPSQMRKDEKRNAMLNNENTFESIAREWHANNIERWTPSYGKEILHRLQMNIFPTIGQRPIRDIATPELLATLRLIEKRGAHEVAHRALQMCGQVFRYGIAAGRLERDPSPDLRGALKPVKHTHYAALDTKDLPAFIQALECNDGRLYPQTRLGLKLMLLTFVRTGELIGATWDEVNFDTKQWVIPASRMKMRKEHIVPLSHQALQVLSELKVYAGDRMWVFPSQINSQKHMSNNTILKALERMGYKGKTTGHGFRALAMSTIKEKLGYRHEVVDRQLAHGHKSKIDAAYDRAQFLQDRTVMMQRWADYLDHGYAKQPDNILSFSKS